MQLQKALSYVAALTGALLCTACAVPSYDVPRTEYGKPTVKTIVERIQCEIRDVVRNDRLNDDPSTFHRDFLLNGDYDVQIALSLEVNDTGWPAAGSVDTRLS